MRGKLSLSLAIAIALSSLVATQFYCTKKSTQEKAIPLDQPLSLIRSIDPRATYTVGEIQITTNNAGDIIILANVKDTANEKMFLLMANTNKIALNKTFKHAEVIYLLHSILINSLDSKERYYLAVAKPDEREIYAKLPASYKSFFTTSLNGYGVIQVTGFLPGDISAFHKNSNPYSDLYRYRAQARPGVVDANISPDDSAPGAPECSNGGKGSSGCSIGSGSNSCSVSCQSGYYSCCNPGVFSPSCKCYAN